MFDRRGALCPLCERTKRAPPALSPQLRQASIWLLLVLLRPASAQAPATPHTLGGLTEGGITRLAAIGDFGADAAGGAGREAQAAALVTALNRQSRLSGILALGDTNYPAGAASTIDRNVGKYFGDFMWPLNSSFSQGAPDQQNRFFPCPGNHDWLGPGGALGPYLSYMPVSGRRYYDVQLPHVHIFSLDSDPAENRFDGTSPTSTQGQWLKSALAASTAPWKLVMSHHPPFSSGSHGNSAWMQWPFEEWGASAVFSGHDHTFERLVPGPSGFPYFVNGLGGASSYSFGSPLASSMFRFTGRPGVQLIQADAQRMQISFLPMLEGATQLNTGNPVDCYEITQSASGEESYRLCATNPSSSVAAPGVAGQHSDGSSSTSTSSSSSSSGSGSGEAVSSHPQCAANDQKCSAMHHCCEPNVCHMPEKRCGAPHGPADFFWMRRSRRVKRLKGSARATEPNLT